MRNVKRNIIFNQLYVLNAADRRNAVAKARKDVTHTFVSLGYEDYSIFNRIYPIPFLTGFLVYLSMFRFWLSVGHGNNIVIQYPSAYSTSLLLRFIKLLKVRHHSVSIVIHDSQILRYGKKDEIERCIFNEATSLFVHTKAMQEALVQNGCKSKMYIINLFDYYCDDAKHSATDLKNWRNIVVFAGNLDKSTFLSYLIYKNNLFKSTILHLYGYAKEWNSTSTFIYKGSFLPEKTGNLIGGWGLVWDGDSIDTCGGVAGEYLRFNASHKLSLYLAAGLPVIVWDKSAVAHWVKENGVGVTIDNLWDLEDTINGLSDGEYTEMVGRVAIVGSCLREGKFLKQVIENESIQ